MVAALTTQMYFSSRCMQCMKCCDGASSSTRIAYQDVVDCGGSLVAPQAPANRDRRLVDYVLGINSTQTDSRKLSFRFSDRTIHIYLRNVPIEQNDDLICGLVFTRYTNLIISDRVEYKRKFGSRTFSVLSDISTSQDLTD